MRKRKSFFITGVVQGVGFRPFVYKTALKNSLNGFVKNDESGVELEIEGEIENIELFEKQLQNSLPPLARIDSFATQELEVRNYEKFEIIESSHSLQNAKTALISPDIATCEDCLKDLKTPGKYHNYFATNCTNCGPRYSIVKTVPYDRINTSMSVFEMCESCQKEYNDPNSRRYHAQPISCNECGPKLSLWDVQTKQQLSRRNYFEDVAKHIEEGKIVAIKGIGGFHIVCDATNDEVLLKLRKAKNRASKPFAILCKDLLQVQSVAIVSEKEKELLGSKEAPIVILSKDSHAKISHLVAPKIDRIGCMVGYTPLHHLLFEHLSHPVVATSANLGDEPIIITKDKIFEKLPFIDFVLDFDREIVNGVDDSLVQVVNDAVQMLRLARGYAPKVIKHPFENTGKILAVGANAKSTLSLVQEQNIILSPHIGDLDSLEAFGYFERTFETFRCFYDFTPDCVVYDKHPNYLSTKWAKVQEVPHVEIGHHLAHVYACKAEFGLQGEYLGFSFDGTGYGDDMTLWGGEVFVGDERKYYFKPLKLLGAAKAIKEPRRVALSMLFEKLSFEEVAALDLACVKEFPHAELKLLHQSYTKNLNAPLSSSVGRLFDAVASLAEIVQTISYEGESGLLCESYYDAKITESFEYVIKNGEIEIEMISCILEKKPGANKLCSMFINTLAKIMLDIAKLENKEVILSGGVFQNKTLLELIACELEKANITYYHQGTTPINDGGISLGQAYYVLSHEGL